MKEPDYRGLAALIIAVCGAFGIFVVVPLAVLMGNTLGEVGSDVIIALGGVLVGSLATYMGMHGEKILPQALPKTTQKPTEKNDADTNSD